MMTITVLFETGRPAGRVEVRHGRVVALKPAAGTATSAADAFEFTADGPCRLEVSVDGEMTQVGAGATIISVRAGKQTFSFFLRDVNPRWPIYVPDLGVAVTAADDPRSYQEIRAGIDCRGLQTALQRISSAPEESWEQAAAACKDRRCPTWLGLGRDMRLFSVSVPAEINGIAFQAKFGNVYVIPQFHGYPALLKATGGRANGYSLSFGKGSGCVEGIRRRLEDGLPILHADMLADDDIAYEFTTFCGLEHTELREDTVRGTHYLVADSYGYGHTFSDEQQAERDRREPEETHREEETVLYMRTVAINTGQVPRYAWYKAPWVSGLSHSYDGAGGVSLFDGSEGSGPAGAFAVSRLNGKPLPQEEVAVLLMPGESATFESFLPHQPLPEQRARALAAQDFTARLDECRSFWTPKLTGTASFHLPEPRVDEMVRAGLAHLDILAHGLEPNGPVAPMIGGYSPIGSESSPIIQFFDAMGHHDLARRCLMYFLDKTREDGCMNNYMGYKLENGCVLWTVGEHYRYTHDDEWIRQVAPTLLKAAQYLVNWRRRNQVEELRGRGWGMLEGQVGDPEDEYRIFMLNGYAYLGLRDAAALLANIYPTQAAGLRCEAEGLREDTREALFAGIQRSPVVPLGDGTWVPSAPPWAEGTGPMGLYAEYESAFTHAALLCRDSIAGPLYLIFQEVLEPDEPAARWLLEAQADLMHMRNVALTQPYYSRHPWVHLVRGEVSAFIKAWYNGFAGLADRETYTFWEHYWEGSPNKTHELAWCLMETRWMLYLERGQTLRLFPGVPRAWLGAGRNITLDRVASWFGPLSVNVTSVARTSGTQLPASSHPEGSPERILATIECSGDRRPGRVELRLPHPQSRRATRVSGGTYDPATETVVIEDFSGSAEVVVEF